MHRSLLVCMFLALILGFFFQNAFPVQTQGVLSDRSIYDNWLSVQKSIQDSSNNEIPFRNRISEKYLNLYQDTDNIVYLDFALHEALSEKRHEIIDQLSDQEGREISDVIEKLIRGNFRSDYLSIRDFSASDIYTFHGPDISGEKQDQARKLLDYWLSTLPQDYEENTLQASLKAQTLVLGYNKLDDFDKVFEVGRYLTRSHPFPNSSFTYYLFNIITYASRVQGYYSEALNIYTDILFPMAEALGFSDRYLILNMDYALTLFRIGDVNASLQEFEEIYSQGIQNLDPRYRPALLNNLAISYLNAGQFDQYVQFQLEAFEIAREEENYDQQLEILRNLFIFYRRQDETELAINYLNQALDLAQENNLLSETSSILLSLGWYKRETENAPEEALEHFQESLKLSQESDDYQQIINSHIDLAETYLILNNFDVAEKHIRDAIQLSRSRSDQRNYIQASVRYGNILIEQNKFDEANDVIQEFSAEDLQQIPFYVEVLGYNVKSKVFTHFGEINQAKKISSSIIEEIIIWLQESTDLQTGHMRMDKEFSEAFRIHTELLYELEEYQEALAVIGRLRNLSRTGFYNNPLLKSQVLSEEQLIRDYHLSNRIQDLRNRYARANEEQKVFLGNQIAEAVAERNELQDEAFPNYVESDYENSLPEVMEELDSDQMAIYMSVFEDEVFQFLITRSGIDMKVYPAEANYTELLENAVASFGSGSTDLNLLYEVYQTFYRENIPTGINHIYMIPDGIFYRIPIEILPVEPVHSSMSYGSARYLIENYSVSYLNTLSDLVSPTPETDFLYDMAGFGISDFSAAGHPELPNLPFSPREITNSTDRIEKFTNNRFFIDEQSTESNFREIAGKAKIIHMATHSKVNDESPLFSSLYLYEGPKTSESTDTTLSNKNDGIVHAYELFDLNLNADLIFLSSCESGSGGYLKGSGILGFSRAFTYAGAQSLSINLWPIRDQTASEISLRFYEALNDGANKAEALRQARLSYLNNSNSDPYLWGAFILYGNIESPIDNQLFTNFLFSGLIITGLFFIALFVYQKKTLIKSWIL